ncbi:MAG: hypothetical protein J5554_11065 [Paludibacteraceae bacterium]|nr:hypothetical protein [Paludibacteraceae bacterium]
MEKMIFCLISIPFAITISSCKDDLQEEGECHAFYTLVNKSDYDIRLRYFENTPYAGYQLYDTIIKRDSSFVMEEIWDIPASPFHFVDTLQVSFGSVLMFEDYSTPIFLELVNFAHTSNYEFLEDKEHIRRATYTITNADYEYAKQKLAEREANNGGE